MDYQTEQYLEGKVEAFMIDGTSFTSLDIANLAKEAGFWVRNREVAEWLRSNAIATAYAMGALYNQTLIRVDSKAAGITLAYLYHHMDVDPDSYLDRDQNPKRPGVGATPAPVHTSAPDTVSLIVASATPVQTSTRRRVEQRNMATGYVIAVYDSPADAQTATSVDASGISKAARGVRNSAGGYKWAYI